MTVHDPFAQVIEAAEIDCGDPLCFGICDLGPLPGESRAAHVARLKARFSCDPEIVEASAGRHSIASVQVTCAACGRQRARGHECVYCARIAPPSRRNPA